MVRRPPRSTRTDNTRPRHDARPISLAKKQGLRHASSGVGSSQHLAAAQFGKAAGIELLHVPYKGSAQALNDLLSGEVDMNVDSPPLMVPNIKIGRAHV